MHFVGIGGISMSGLAEILNFEGFKVSGSDIKESDITKTLREQGIEVIIGQKAENIKDDTDIVVYTVAVKHDNPEILAAEAKGIPVIERATLLGAIMSCYKNSIAVSGTHGKTTTTSMVSEITMCANLDPTISVGGILQSIGGNIRLGSSDYFVAEACEYFDSFLHFKPYVGVILTIDADHLDYFKNLENIRKSFHRFAENIAMGGALVINTAIPRYKEIIEGLKPRVITYGSTDKTADVYADNIDISENGTYSFDIYSSGKYQCRVSLKVPGRHNVDNALAAFAAANVFEIDNKYIIQGLENFGGTDRRFQYKGKFDGVTVIDDYAHHPTEVKATLAAAKNINKNKLWCIFQPHTYSRTYNLLKEFSEAFDDADKIIVADIYAAREKDTGLINSATLAEKIKEHGTDAVYVGDFNAIKDYIKQNCSEGDLLITMGAGDVYLIGESLVQA
ncbi:MAG: UDP-N-acetylmuramate--L-alanine ligase [Clostridiales bacterium]|nr:UDP-N-acetylmuramate--L-alanine ligase [Clostridiales bacterium]